MSEDPKASFQHVLHKSLSTEVQNHTVPKSCQKKTHTHTPLLHDSGSACGLRWLKMLTIQIASLTLCSSSQTFTNTGSQSEQEKDKQSGPFLPLLVWPLVAQLSFQPGTEQETRVS